MTLAEILVCLLILAEVATFAIPKVLAARQDRSWDTNTKQVAGAISTAYQAYRLNNPPNANTKAADLTPYLNYVRIDTTSQFDAYTVGTLACNTPATYTCLRLHNGGLLVYEPGMIFNGTAPQNALIFRYDPDGKDTTTGTSHDKSVGLFVYLNGRITSFAGIIAGTTNNYYTYGGAGTDPPWLKWSS